jgi:hypothetical protein
MDLFEDGKEEEQEVFCQQKAIAAEPFGLKILAAIIRT